MTVLDRIAAFGTGGVATSGAESRVLLVDAPPGGRVGLLVDEVLGVRRLAHAMEDILDDRRGERRRMNGRSADVLFKTVDRLRELVEDSATTARRSPNLARWA